MPSMPNPTRENESPFIFPRGLAGFPDAHAFGFIYEGRGDIVCLQSVDRPEVALLLAAWDPKRLGPEPELGPEERELLGVGADDELVWLVVLNPFASTEWVTANLKAPIVVSPETRRGLQLIRADEMLPLRYPWMRQPQRQAA